MKWKEYRNEIPYNTLKTWSRHLLDTTHWKQEGWTGVAKEPYRHWCHYPEFDGMLTEIWKAMNESFIGDGIFIKPDRVVMNLYNHGDSSWLHKDSDDEDAWTAIIFLNEFWDINWGGDFVLVEHNELLAAFAATPGKFVLFKSNLLHGARPVSREAPIARFGIAFQCKNDSNIQAISKPKISPVCSPI